MAKLSEFAYIYEHDLDQGSEEYEFLMNLTRTIGAVMESKVTVDAFKKNEGVEVTFFVTSLGVQHKVFYPSLLIWNALRDVKTMDTVYQSTHREIEGGIWNVIR